VREPRRKAPHRQRSVRRRWALPLTTCLLVVLPFPLGAAGQPPAPSDAAFSTVVVTAQRRAEDLHDVPVAIAVLDNEALAAAGVADAMQLQTVVPSLTYPATGYAAQPYLRGIGTRQFAIGLEPSIATYIDDRYVPRPFAATFDMLDVERVEVLKGPQGVLYGRNAAGGAIRAITKDPREAETELGATIGDYGARRLRFTAGGPIAASWRGQIAAAVERRDGFAANLVPTGRAEADDLDRQAVRGKLLWDATDAVTAKLALSWWEYTDWTGRDLMAVGVPEANRGEALYGGVTSRRRDAFATGLAGDNHLRELAADLRFDVRLRNLDFVSITTFTDETFAQTLDIDVSSVPLVDLVASEPSETWSQEFHLLSRDDSAVDWLAGAYLYGQDASNVYVFENAVSAQPQSPAGTDVSNGLQEVRTDAYALFAQISQPLGERWTASLGARWSREQKAATLAAVPGTETNAPTPYADTSDWDDVTPRLSLEYRGRFGLAYVSYARGFKSGGYNYPASLNPVLNPETLDSYEIGSKLQLADGRVQLSSAMFFYDVDDLQVTRGGAGSFLTTENAASGRARGLEVDVTAAVGTGLELRGGVALIDSQYTDYTAGVLVPQLVPPYGSIPLPGGLDVRGQSLLRSPDAAAYVGLHHERPLARGGRLPVSVTYSYKSDYYFDFSAIEATEWLRQDDYGVLNARVAYVSETAAWEIGLWGRNLTDTAYYEDAVLTSVSSRVSYADPRTLGVDFRLRL
jgi:iron complex outermembrane receptor protein